jgi:hypothetical protein
VGELLAEVLDFLRCIQRGQKGSIGAIDNVYLPQLDRRRVDALAARVLAALCSVAREGETSEET